MAYVASDSEKSLMTCLTVSIEYRRVTDRQTDILRQHSPRYAQHPVFPLLNCPPACDDEGRSVKVLINIHYET